MMRKALSTPIAIAAILILSLSWLGCGGDGGPAATFNGNVALVSPPQARLSTQNRTLFARTGSFLLPEAVAQSPCPAAHVLICVNNGTRTICRPVSNGDCEFGVSIDARDDFALGELFFVNDTNEDGSRDAGEARAFLSNPLGRICNGSVVTLIDVAIDFSTPFAVAASVEKNPDTCSSSRTPTPTGPTPTRTATRTPTPIGGVPTATPTPTYAYGSSLNTPPSSMLALLSGVVALGLLLPARRRKRR